jgi:hypothetical protein
MLSITHHTRKRPTTSPWSTQALTFHALCRMLTEMS